MRRLFAKYAPDQVYAYVANLYWKLSSNRENVRLRRRGEWWLSIYDKKELLLPSPKQAYDQAVFDEPYEDLLKVEEGDIVVDAGASVGAFSQSVVDRADIVIALEPELSNAECLKKNLSDYTNVEVVEKALWSEGGSASFELKDSILGHRISVEGYDRVDTVTLEEIADTYSLERIDFLKMDIEGAEVEALKGAGRGLDITRKAVIAAYHERRGKKTAEQVQQLLDDRGFDVSEENDFVYAKRT